MSEDLSKQKLIRLLDQVETILASEFLGSFKLTITQDIADTEATILAIPPTDVQSVAEVNQLFGRRALLVQNLSLFETFRASLKEELANIDEPPSESADNTNENDL